MRNICFYFQVHQPYRLRTYRFFDIGKRHFYYDDYNNRITMQRVAERCYIPMNNLGTREQDEVRDFVLGSRHRTDGGVRAICLGKLQKACGDRQCGGAGRDIFALVGVADE